MGNETLESEITMSGVTSFKRAFRMLRTWQDEADGKPPAPFPPEEDPEDRGGYKTLEIFRRMEAWNSSKPAKKMPRGLSNKRGWFRDVPPPGYCIYFLIKGTRVIYVGRTTDAVKRLRQHGRSKGHDRVLYLSVREQDYAETEYLFISRLRPRLNKNLRGPK